MKKRPDAKRFRGAARMTERLDVRRRKLDRFVAIFLGLALAAPAAFGAAGRDFAGFYAIRRTSDLGGEVAVDLVVEIHNVTDDDAYAATIEVTDLLQLEDPYATFYVAHLDARDRARIEGEIVVPRGELERWQQSGGPLVWVECENGAGERRRLPVEMAPLPFIAEEGGPS